MVRPIISVTYLFVFLITISCNRNSGNVNGEVNDLSQDESGEYQQLKRELENSYDHVIKLDSSFQWGDEMVILHFTFFCNRRDSIEVPVKYNWSKDKEQLITYQFEGNVTLESNKNAFSVDVKKNLFNEIIAKDLKDYGVICYPNFRGVINDEMIFQLSVSIPLTDVGTSVLFYLRKDGSHRVSME